MPRNLNVPPTLRPGRVSPGFLLRPVVSGTHGTGSLWLDHSGEVKSHPRVPRPGCCGHWQLAGATIPVGDNDFS